MTSRQIANFQFIIEYHKDHPAFPSWLPFANEPQIMLGAMDTEDSKFEVMLGVWKALSDEVPFFLFAFLLISVKMFGFFYRFVIGLWQLWIPEPWSLNTLLWPNHPLMFWLVPITIMELVLLIHLSKNGIGIPTKILTKF